ncbi:GPW/gp25 family protein [Sphingobium tyrosinilyticum]|uniref:GPW/gp25 family protein n=1 Tax=Sphingobium tyrosinilyticum TaxID=2715436 RepID=A0ABV9EVZ2_9SPHN
MAGMSRLSGAPLDGFEHIKQSVADILGTPLGTRVGRRDYGSLLPDLIDQPMTPANILRVYAATAVAISRFEDRIRLRRISLSAGERAGSAIITLDAERTDTAAANARTRLVLPLSL